MKNKTEIADSDLISARKAAIAFSQDAKDWKSEVTGLWSMLSQERKQRPIFLVVGVMVGALGVLLATTFL